MRLKLSALVLVLFFGAFLRATPASAFSFTDLQHFFFPGGGAILGESTRHTATDPGTLHQDLRKGRVDYCLKSKDNLNNRYANVSGQLTREVAKLDEIVNRIKNYYATRVQAKGKAVSNYDTLLSDLNSKKALLAPALSQLQTDKNAISCTPDLTKTEQFGKFNKDVMVLRGLLKSYRESIRNLRNAVAQAAGVGKTTQ